MGIQFNGNKNPYTLINNKRTMKPNQPEKVITDKVEEGNVQKGAKAQEQKSADVMSWQQLDYKLIYNTANIKISTPLTTTDAAVKADSSSSVSGAGGASTGSAAKPDPSTLSNEEYTELLTNSFNVSGQFDASVSHDFTSPVEPDNTQSANTASISNNAEYKNILSTASNEVLKNVVNNMKKNGLTADVELVKSVITLTNYNLSRSEIFNKFGSEVSYQQFYNFYAEKFNEEFSKFLNEVGIDSIRNRQNQGSNVDADETASAYRAKMEDVYCIESDVVASNDANLGRTITVSLPKNYKESIEQGTCVKLREQFDKLLSELVRDLKSEIIKNCYKNNVKIDSKLINNAVNNFKANMNYKTIFDRFANAEIVGENFTRQHFEVTIDVQGFKTYALSSINEDIRNNIQTMEQPVVPGRRRSAPDLHEDLPNGGSKDTYYNYDSEGNIIGGVAYYYEEGEEEAFCYEVITRDNQQDGSYVETIVSYEDGKQTEYEIVYHNGNEERTLWSTDNEDGEMEGHIYTRNEDGDLEETATIEAITDEDTGITVTTTTEEDLSNDYSYVNVIVTNSDGEVLYEYNLTYDEDGVLLDDTDFIDEFFDMYENYFDEDLMDGDNAGDPMTNGDGDMGYGIDNDYGYGYA